MKTCRICQLALKTDQFYPNSRTKDLLRSECKACQKAHRAIYVDQNKARIAARMRDYHEANRPKLLAQQRQYKVANSERLAALKREKETGFSPGLFATTLAQQNYGCAICAARFSDLTKQQCHADHCHTTGKPRGVLCQTCNTGLGKFKDNPELLRVAAAYLENPPCPTP